MTNYTTIFDPGEIVRTRFKDKDFTAAFTQLGLPVQKDTDGRYIWEQRNINYSELQPLPNNFPAIGEKKDESSPYYILKDYETGLIYRFLGWHWDTDPDLTSIKPCSGYYKDKSEFDYYYYHDYTITLVATWGIEEEHSIEIDFPVNLTTHPYVKKSQFYDGFTVSDGTHFSHSGKYGEVKKLSLDEMFFGDLPVKSNLKLDMNVSWNGLVTLGNGHDTFQYYPDKKPEVLIKNYKTDRVGGLKTGVDVTMNVDTFLSSYHTASYHLSVEHNHHYADPLKLKKLTITLYPDENELNKNSPHTIIFKHNDAETKYENQLSLCNTEFWPEVTLGNNQILEGWYTTINDVETKVDESNLKNYITLTEDLTLTAKILSKGQYVETKYTYGKDNVESIIQNYKGENLPADEDAFKNDLDLQLKLKESAPNIPLNHLSYIKDNKTYIFNGWNTKFKKEEDSYYYLVEANYKQTSGYTQQFNVEGKETNIPYEYSYYLEPYCFGSGTPDSNYYKIGDYPIGEDNNSKTSDIKFQQYDGSSYAVQQKLPGFAIDRKESKIYGIRKGTYPKINKNEGEDVWSGSLTKATTDSTASNIADTINYTLTVKYNEDKQISEITIDDSSDKLKLPFPPNDDNDSTWDPYPTRLGVLLVGGGGGAGGYNYYTDNSSGTNTADDNAVVPGSGGGGGEIVLGVLNLAYPDLNLKEGCVAGESLLNCANGLNDNAKVTKLEFKFTGGQGGYSNGASDADRGSSGGEAKNGTDGNRSAVWLQITVNDGTEYTTKYIEVLGAAGGKGGYKGDFELSQLNGGLGGTSKHSDQTHCWYITSKEGGQGGGLTIKDDSGQATSVAAYSYDLYFSSNKPDSTEYIISKNKEKLDSSNAGSIDQSKQTGWIRGGYSFGDEGTDQAPSHGGGGSCLKSKSKKELDPKNKDTAEPTNGANGFIALYY